MNLVDAMYPDGMSQGKYQVTRYPPNPPPRPGPSQAGVRAAQVAGFICGALFAVVLIFFMAM